MANYASARKRIRQIKRRTVVNRSRVGRIRTYVRRVELAIAEGDKVIAAAALKAAQPEMMRGVTKGVAHRNTVARGLSRLSARIKAMEG
jgi:small subunit ribosomal protein S20